MKRIASNLNAIFASSFWKGFSLCLRRYNSANQARETRSSQLQCLQKRLSSKVCFLRQVYLQEEKRSSKRNQTQTSSRQLIDWPQIAAFSSTRVKCKSNDDNNEALATITKPNMQLKAPHKQRNKNLSKTKCANEKPDSRAPSSSVANAPQQIQCQNSKLQQRSSQKSITCQSKQQPANDANCLMRRRCNLLAFCSRYALLTTLAACSALRNLGTEALQSWRTLAAQLSPRRESQMRPTTQTASAMRVLSAFLCHY